ncbi:MAG: Carbon-nitrogen hydrolase, partial [Candelina submexicana]
MGLIDTYIHTLLKSACPLPSLNIFLSPKPNRLSPKTTGYNFPSLPSITPFLEPTTSGPSTRWALSTAERLHCNVTIGYPETTLTPRPNRYNSAVTVSPSGAILAHYRKHFLYYTDESWAEEGKERFFEGTIEGLGK